MELKGITLRVYTACMHRWYGILFIRFIKYILSRDILGTKLRITNHGSIRIYKYVMGRDNILRIGKNSCLDGVTIKIQGSNNTILIGDNTVIGRGCRLFLFGNNLKLEIGNNCTFNHDDEILVQEDNSCIKIGNDCMFSHHINVRTSDAHPIYYSDTEVRANKAKDIYIGNHVWCTAYVIVQKGSCIGDGCVIGTYSVVNRRSGLSDTNDAILSNAIIAGIPAKIVKSGIEWKRDF